MCSLKMQFEHQKIIRKNLGETLVALNYATKEQVVEALAEAYSLPIMRVRE